MFKKVLGWGLVVFGAIGALLGLLVVIGGEAGDGGTMIGISAVLATTGWGMRNPAGTGGGSSGAEHDWDTDSSSDDSGWDGADSGSDSID